VDSKDPPVPALSSQPTKRSTEAEWPPAPRPTATSGRRVWISEEDLLKRLALRSESIVDDIYGIAKQQLDDEDKRDGVLTAKANTVLGASGLSLTVAFTFGGLLLQHPETVVVGFGLVVFAFAIAMVLGLLASYFALRGLRIGQFEYVNEASVFDQDNLRDTDNAYDSAWERSKRDPAAADRAAVTVYRRFLAAHLWGIYQRTFEKLEAKAENVKWAQRLYVGFLGAIMVIGMVLTAAVGIAGRPTIGSAAPARSRSDASTGSSDAAAQPQKAASFAQPRSGLDASAGSTD
jgi:hypothetical protein